VAAQAEYSTDVMFKTASGLRDLYPRLLSHSTLCFGAKEVMNFLGRKLNGHFQGEVVIPMRAALPYLLLRGLVTRLMHKSRD
jgi:hypothetical protein